MTSRRSLHVLLLTALLSACGGGGGGGDEARDEAGTAAQAESGPASGSASDSDPEAELVAWLDDFCSAASTATLPSPPVAPMPSTEADRQPLLDLVAEVEAAMADAQDAVSALPPPPVAAGNDLVEAYVADVEAFRSKVAGYVSDATSFPVESLDVVYRLIGVDLATYVPGGEGWKDHVEGHPELSEAYDHASSCL